MQPQTLVVVALVPLIAWRMYSRVRRMIGRQKSRAWRHWTALVLFPLLLAAVGLGAARSPAALEALGGGAAAGVVLAIVGLRLTRYERTAEGWFYTPNAHIGIAISVAFAARIVWRFMELRGSVASVSAGAPPDFARSPLTLLVFGILAAYYATYAAGILRWRLAGSDPGPAPPAA